MREQTEVILDGAGGAVYRFANDRAYRVKQVIRVTLTPVGTITTQPIASLRWHDSKGQMIDQTITGAQDTFDSTNLLDVWPGEALVLVWAEGTPGDTVLAGFEYRQ